MRFIKNCAYCIYSAICRCYLMIIIFVQPFICECAINPCNHLFVSVQVERNNSENIISSLKFKMYRYMQLTVDKAK